MVRALRRLLLYCRRNPLLYVSRAAESSVKSQLISTAFFGLRHVEVAKILLYEISQSRDKYGCDFRDSGVDT